MAERAALERRREDLALFRDPEVAQQNRLLHEKMSLFEKEIGHIASLLKLCKGYTTTRLPNSLRSANDHANDIAHQLLKQRESFLKDAEVQMHQEAAKLDECAATLRDLGQDNETRSSVNRA